MPRQTDDPTVLDALSTMVRYILRDHRGPRVGLVTKYDSTKRTADVQPVRRRRLRGKIFDESPVVDAPVAWPRFGTMVIAGELQAGDEVLLITCEREIRPWLLSGLSHDPQSQRMHAAEDSVVLPTISSFARAITARAAGTFYLGREDATAGVTITQAPAVGRVTLEGTGAASIQLGSTATIPALLGTTANSALNTYAAAITAANSALNTEAQTYYAIPAPTPGQKATFAAAFAAWNTATAAAQTALATSLAASLTTKTVLE